MKGLRRIIGIDPGLASTGWGVIDCKNGKLRYIDHGNIETKAGRPLAERLFSIFDAVRSILETYKPVEAAVEMLYFGKNVSSAIPVAEAEVTLDNEATAKALRLIEKLEDNEDVQNVYTNISIPEGYEGDA